MKTAMTERRSASRQKSFLQGRIFFNNRRTSVDCLVRDFCQHGARLKFSSMTATPDVVELYIPNKDESYRAKVQWRNADEIGVGFDFDDAAPPLAPGEAPADWSARINKLEHDLGLLQRKFNELQAVLRQLQGAD
jgi:PilZ domain